jgi:hypothetical protein
MKTATRWAVIALAVAGLGIFSAIPSIAESTTQPSQINTEAGTGTVVGTVLKDGKPLPNARVALFVKVPHPKGKTLKRDEVGNGADKDNAATTQPASEDGKKKHEHADATATATSDADGKFMLKDVPAGDYVILAGLPDEGRGHERIAVTVGQTATIDVPVAVAGEKTHGGKRLRKLGI